LKPRLTFLPGRGSAAAAGALADVGAGICVVVKHLVITTLLLALGRRLVLDVELVVVMRVRVIMLPSSAVVVTVAVHVVHHDAVDALSTVLTIRHYHSHSKTFPPKKN
jgi:hypothetical protein